MSKTYTEADFEKALAERMAALMSSAVRCSVSEDTGVMVVNGIPGNSRGVWFTREGFAALKGAWDVVCKFYADNEDDIVSANDPERLARIRASRNGK